MATATTIVLADNTPADRTFEPTSIDPKRAVLHRREQAAVPPSAWESIILEFKNFQGDAPARVNYRLNVPIGQENAESGRYEIDHIMRARAEFILSPRADSVDRAHLLAMFTNGLFYKAAIRDYVLNLEPMW